MTSNLASGIIQENAENLDKVRPQIMDIVRSNFKPEFINRIDETVIFNSLSRAELKAIVKIQLADFSRRLARQDIKVVFDKSLEEYLAEAGFDPSFGARPLKRVIQNQIVDDLALRIIEGKIKAGDQISLAMKNNVLQVSS